MHQRWHRLNENEGWQGGGEDARQCGEYSWRLIREAVIANDIHWHKNEALWSAGSLLVPHLTLQTLYKLAKIFCSEQARSRGDYFFWSLWWCCTFSGAKKHVSLQCLPAVGGNWWARLPGISSRSSCGVSSGLVMSVSLLSGSLCVLLLTDVSALRRSSLLQQTTNWYWSPESSNNNQVHVLA